jgi:hypothetical protein
MNKGGIRYFPNVISTYYGGIESLDQILLESLSQAWGCLREDIEVVRRAACDVGIDEDGTTVRLLAKILRRSRRIQVGN